MINRFYGSYILVISFKDNIENILKNVLSASNIKERQQNIRTRIIWLCPEWNSNVDDVQKSFPKEYYNKGILPNEWFVEDIDMPLPDSVPAKISLNILCAETYELLIGIESKLLEAIIFSNNNKEDSQIPLIVGILRKYFPEIEISSECSSEHHVQEIIEAGVDEVFNRRKMMNELILSILQGSKLPSFLESIFNQKKNDFGLNSALFKSLKLKIEKNYAFILKKNNQNNFNEILSKNKAKCIAVFKKTNGNFELRPINYNNEVDIVLNNGDSLLIIVNSIKNLNNLESIFSSDSIKEFIYNKK